jgi:MSHA pilin protein MshD
MNQRGVTLVELVVSIVVVAIAISAVLGTLTFASTSSADAMVRQQAVSIASAYLEEVLLRSYSDPDGIDGESTRAAFDDVDDYAGLSNTGAQDQLGSAIDGLEQYRVHIEVVPETIGGVNALRIDVSVDPPSGPTVVLSGYRTNI